MEGDNGVPQVHSKSKEQGCEIYQINFRLPNDGFLYLAPGSDVTCPITPDVAAGVEIPDGHPQLLHSKIPAWLELSSAMLSTSFLPAQQQFITWLEKHVMKPEPPNPQIGSNVFYNPTFRRFDVRLTDQVAPDTKIEWQIRFEPGAPALEYVERMIEGAWH